MRVIAIVVLSLVLYQLASAGFCSSPSSVGVVSSHCRNRQVPSSDDDRSGVSTGMQSGFGGLHDGSSLIPGAHQGPGTSLDLVLPQGLWKLKFSREKDEAQDDDEHSTISVLTTKDDRPGTSTERHSCPVPKLCVRPKLVSAASPQEPGTEFSHPLPAGRLMVKVSRAKDYDEHAETPVSATGRPVEQLSIRRSKSSNF
ncbi:hypothetical protein SeLEV6574_g08051 [Synchytrium endobioticum]|nr:hypothetical protein SeLEV6574_g08051 [Synchytrium endobioticum]